MAVRPGGKHLVAREWLEGQRTFSCAPRHVETQKFMARLR